MLIRSPDRVAYLPVNLGMRTRGYQAWYSYQLSGASAEVPDFWYERRIGDLSPAEKRRYRVYRKKFPARGNFSALCHVKPQFEVYEVPGRSSSNRPPDTSRLWAWGYRYGNSYDALPLDEYIRIGIPYADTVVAGVYETFCVNSVGELVKVLYEVSFRMIFQYDGFVRIYSTGATGHYGRNGQAVYFTDGRAVGGIDERIPEDEIRAGYDFSPIWQKIDAALQTYVPVRGTASDYMVTIENEVGDIDYAKAEYQRAVRSALRYEDTQLVDYSVGASRVVPWAFQNIDVVAGRSGAYVKALEDVPLMSDNALQNLNEAFAGLASFAFSAEAASYFDKLSRIDSPVNWYKTNARGLTARAERARQRALNRGARRARWDPADIISGLDQVSDPASDAWLKGRYAFSTSVMDLGQAWDYFYDRALQNIGKRSDDYKCHALFTTNECTFRCGFTVRERALMGVTKFFEHCYRHGLEPNAYVMWDFVPFSFVVDWFFPVGNALEAYTRASHFVPEYWEYQPIYDGKAICYSAAYTTPTAFGPMDVYTRWYEAGPPEVEPAVMLTPGRASEPTTLMRAIDGIALFH